MLNTQYVSPHVPKFLKLSFRIIFNIYLSYYQFLSYLMKKSIQIYNMDNMKLDFYILLISE